MLSASSTARARIKKRYKEFHIIINALVFGTCSPKAKRGKNCLTEKGKGEKLTSAAVGKRKKEKN